MAANWRSAAFVSPDCKTLQASRCSFQIVGDASEGSPAGKMKSGNLGAPAGTGVAAGFLAHAPAASNSTTPSSRNLRGNDRPLLVELCGQAPRQVRFDDDALV